MIYVHYWLYQGNSPYLHWGETDRAWEHEYPSECQWIVPNTWTDADWD